MNWCQNTLSDAAAYLVITECNLCMLSCKSEDRLLQNLVALVPLAWLLGCTTEVLALRCGPAAGGLINATFGNAPELILSIIALLHGLTTVALASLLGSVLSNLLLVLGACAPERLPVMWDCTNICCVYHACQCKDCRCTRILH